MQSIDDFINSINIFDLLVLGALMGMFVLGYIQGVIRRLIGIVSIIFSFVLAANLRGPLGDFLARNWTQFPAEYSRMIGFGVVFAVSAIGLALIVQFSYKPAALWPKMPLRSSSALYAAMTATSRSAWTTPLPTAAQPPAWIIWAH